MIADPDPQYSRQAGPNGCFPNQIRVVASVEIADNKVCRRGRRKRLTMAFPRAHSPRPFCWGLLGVFIAALPAFSAVDDAPIVSTQAEPAQAEKRSDSLEQLDARLRKLAPQDERVARLLDAVDAGDPPSTIETVLSGDPLVGAPRSDIALRVAAEHLAARRYEECLAWLEVADPAESNSPELYWHYAAVANHQLVRMPQAGDAADALLALRRTTSRRVRELAELIQRDAQAHKDGTLTHITHQMNDVSRRLSLGQAGEPNQTLQQQVIDSLDKMIDEIEQQRKEQQQQQQQQQIAQGGRGGSAQPMQDSRPADLKGAGEVDDRDLPSGGEWGSLPPAERERVAQQIVRDFPAHYREVIEDYFRSLATAPEQEGER